ncbi:protein AMN1 homolog [Macadamia integrifolia]|uniref:protein AMN1 homolog n=1 Tax=Macadamia integrifolia TaxID=60698 RepID=UPI001C52C7C2|nr:protein AMN1 homolog [Macadamia integrifolia]
MEKAKPAALTYSLQKRDHSAEVKFKIPQPYRSPFAKAKPPSLVSLCIGIIGEHLEDIIPDLDDIAASFPPHVKMPMAAIARRRKLLNDDVLISLAESSWDILDVSGSDVSDYGLARVAEKCKSLRAVDISRCSKITPQGVSVLVQHCHLLEILRCGGCPRSEYTARRCLGILKPELNCVEEESWEELDSMEIANGAQSLRWLVWPKIDDDSRESLTTECPRIVVNPKPSLFGFRGVEVPFGALPDISLDDLIVKDIDPRTWATSAVAPSVTIPSISTPNEISMAERFRLAFVERDARLAPKRAKNVRQHRRREDRERVTKSTDAKSIALAAQLKKSLHIRS